MLQAIGTQYSICWSLLTQLLFFFSPGFSSGDDGDDYHDADFNWKTFLDHLSKGLDILLICYLAPTMQSTSLLSAGRYVRGSESEDVTPKKKS